MKQGNKEVVILKPTSVFLSFLAAQATEEVPLPDLATLQTNTTAYTIQRQDSEEETLDEIERHFSTMFQYEINRWLGVHARRDFEGSFLDFLCCFKFEMHAQLVLMEDNITSGQHLLCIKPRSVLLKWMKTAVEQEESLNDVMERVSLTQLCENATVLIKNFSQQADILPFMQSHYHTAFQSEMLRMCSDREFWPAVDSFETFIRYFSVEIHSQLVHLS
jgi:hypothetical protein